MKFLTLIFISLFCFDLSASHLTGGYLSYKRTGIPHDGMVDYVIKLTLFRDCDATVAFDEEIEIGIYYGNDSTLRLPLKTKLSGTAMVQKCQSGCVEQGNYENTISLAENTLGYHLVWERCCRLKNVSIANNSSGDEYQGYAFYAFIPGGDVPNTTPDLSSFSLLRACLNDTAKYILAPYDIEGDSVVCEAVTSYQGASDGEPFPAPKMKFQGLTGVVYKSGYSAIYPLGVSNYYNFDPVTGTISIFCQGEEGLYPLAYSIKEYRNGKLISRSTIETAVIVSVNLCDKKAKPPVISGWAIVPDMKAALKWQSCITNITEQYIEKSIGNTSDFEYIDTVAASQLTYTDTALSAGQVYYYVVHVRTGSGAVLSSDTATVRFWGTGINENSFANALKVYPVPAKDRLTLCVLQSGLKSYSVKDYTGRVILQKVNAEPINQQQIDISSFSPGVFVIEAVMADGSRQLRKIIKE